MVRASWRRHPRGLRQTKRMPRWLAQVKAHLHPRGEDFQQAKTISAIFWTRALLRSTAARRRDATSYTPHSQNHSQADTSTSPEIPHNSQPPRAAVPKTTSAPPADTKHIMHSPYTCWYNFAPNSEYPYATTGLTPGPLLVQLVQLQSTQGYQLEFALQPFQCTQPPPIQMSRGNQQLVHEEMAKLLTKQVVDRVRPTDGEFMSQIFLVPKKDHTQRPVIKLKPLNHCIVKQRLKWREHMF